MAWWKTAKPGDPVVCIDAWWDGPESSPLEEGRVYRIDNVTIYQGPATYRGMSRIGTVEAYVYGAVNPDGYGFAVERFRPAKTADLPESLIKCLDAPVSGKREAVS